MKKNTPFGIAGLLVSIIFLLFMFAGCGDGGGDGAAAPAAGLQKVSGVAQKGPFAQGSTVKAYEYTTIKGDVLAETTVAADASYTLPVFDYVGAVLIEVKGQYTNELTGDLADDYVTVPFEIIIITEETTVAKTYKANLSPAAALATAIIKKEITALGAAPTAEQINGAVLSGYATVATFMGLTVAVGDEAIDAIAQIDIRGTDANDKAVAVFNAKVLKAMTAAGGLFDATSVGTGNKVTLSSLIGAMATAYMAGDINNVDLTTLEVVDADGAAVTATVTLAAGLTANKLFDNVVAVALTADDLIAMNTNLEPEEDLTTTDIDNFQEEASGDLKALALTGNEVTFAKDDTNYEVSGTINNMGVFTLASAIDNDADRTVTFTLDNVGVAAGTYPLDMAFYVKDEAILAGASAKREINALIKGASLVVTTEGVSLSVPDSKTVYWSGQTSAGIAVKGFITNLTANGPVFAGEGSSFIYDGSNLYDSVLDKFGETDASVASFTDVGTYEAGVVCSGVNVGFVSEGKITKLLPFATITVQKMAE